MKNKIKYLNIAVPTGAELEKKITLSDYRKYDFYFQSEFNSKIHSGIITVDRLADVFDFMEWTEELKESKKNNKTNE